jgi:hypothetical protein
LVQYVVAEKDRAIWYPEGMLVEAIRHRRKMVLDKTEEIDKRHFSEGLSTNKE